MIVGGLAQCVNPATLGATVANAAATVFGQETTIETGCGQAVDAAADLPAQVVSSAANGAFEGMALSFGEAGSKMIAFALGWWIAIPGLEEGTFVDLLSTITEYTYYIQWALLIVSVMMLGLRLALARSGGLRDTSEEGFRQLARATVIAGAIGTLVPLGTRISDGIARWFLEGTVGSDPKALAEAMVQVAVWGGQGGVALLFLVGVIGILGGLVMAFLLLMRTGFLVVLSAALPIAAAAGGTKVGAQSYEKMLAWVVAFLLLKPVGAFVIGVSAMMFMKAAPSDPENGGAMTAVVGVLLLASVAFVLPALMRLIVPAIGALGGGGSGLAAAAGAAAVGAKVGGMVASGGASAGAGGMGGAGGGGSSPGGAPTGAPPSFGTPSGGGDPPWPQQPEGNPPSSLDGSGNPAGGGDGEPTPAHPGAFGPEGAAGSPAPGQDTPAAPTGAGLTNHGGFER